LEAISFVQDRLSAEEQELARLRLAGLEWQEIGARIGRDPAALRKQWSRLVERVSRELGA
jgi:DNA-binding NarL/FixJ family response regulator